ncbi:hypothetical protein EMIHUDRAFT_451817, partial [Emiliania huxleyi CCMP1516]|uniref:Uncharacterized protein n=2 Tax=Emiliania huxleyi TaxID=2903 RepID=A0A0D3IT32_EMIH1
MESLPLTTGTAVPQQAGSTLKRIVAFCLTLSAGALLGASISRSGAPAKERTDSSRAGKTPIPSLGEALGQIPTGIGSDLSEGYKANPFYFDPSLRDHVKLTVTPSNTGCGEGGKQLIKPFYINSAKGDAKTFQWCDDGAPLTCTTPRPLQDTSTTRPRHVRRHLPPEPRDGGRHAAQRRRLPQAARLPAARGLHGAVLARDEGAARELRQAAHWLGRLQRGGDLVRGGARRLDVARRVQDADAPLQAVDEVRRLLRRPRRLLRPRGRARGRGSCLTVMQSMGGSVHRWPKSRRAARDMSVSCHRTRMSCISRNSCYFDMIRIC